MSRVTGVLGAGGGGAHEHSWIPEQGLLGVRWLVCTWAWQGLLGHLFVDVPGSHSDPQHGRKRRIVQGNAHLGGENVSQPPPPATCPSTAQYSTTQHSRDPAHVPPRLSVLEAS